ncbi:protein YIPF6 [Selaginella moellendorffii]|uniref:protein YIPF6 n=1 Tax=Selaginella moellendorffii TaxID=88036 RepID=UPI000D1C57E5|nr:protein YIPF6 [Selaginella moellendorffii]|eukprot:XP_002962031.2 protein YIPF6 [Selaginella moellendorffii]
MDALQNLYSQARGASQFRGGSPYNQQEQWFNPPRSSTPPPGFAQQRSMPPPPAEFYQPQRSMPPPPPEFLQQQRSMTPPEFLQRQRSMGFGQPRSLTPPPSFQQQSYDYSSFRQQPRSQTPPPGFLQQQRPITPPRHINQQQFFQQQFLQQQAPYPQQHYQSPYEQQSGQQRTPSPPPRPQLQLGGGASSRPSPATRVSQAVVPEPSAIASTSSTRQEVHSTLTEPVSVTLARDARRVANNLQQIVVFNSNRNDPARTLRDWDLWGPFFFIIALSCILSSTASTNKSTVFAVVFAVLSAGAVSLTMNVVLLGGKLNFLQSLSVLGYCLFPLDIGAILCAAYSGKLYRSAMIFATLLWSSWSVYPFVSTAVRPSRKALAVYPVFLMYISMGLLVLAND